MALEIKRPDELPPRATGIIWGLTGCGKTTFLSSLPQPIVFVMLDPDGKDSIPPHIDCHIIDLTGLSDGETVRALRTTVPAMIEKLDFPTASVVTDSLTVLAERGLNYAIEQKIGEGKNFVPTIEAPGQTAYGARRQYIIHAVSNMLKATSRKGYNCFFTTHDTEVTNDKGELVKYTMMLGGKANNDVGLKISECWWMREHDGKRFIAVRNCRSREPMKSRMFDSAKAAEFELKFDPLGSSDQPHSIATWHRMWIANGRSKLPLPDSAEFKKLYEETMKKTE